MKTFYILIVMWVYIWLAKRGSFTLASECPDQFECMPHEECVVATRIPLRSCRISNRYVCCPLMGLPEPRTRSEQACQEYFHDTTICPEYPLMTGGIEAIRNELQYMAAIEDRPRNRSGTPIVRCGGALISHQFVLSAAHCTKREGSANLDFFVRFGGHNRTDGKRYRVVEKYYNHYNFLKFTNDIVLLKLNESVIFGEKIKPACLPTSVYSIGDLVTLSGWGLLGDDHLSVTNVLFKANMVLRNLDNCDGAHPDKEICVTGVSGISDACQGDSGSPLARWHPLYDRCLGQVVGIVSKGGNFNVRGSSTKHTNVFHYLRWIESVVWGSED